MGRRRTGSRFVLPQRPASDTFVVTNTEPWMMRARRVRMIGAQAVFCDRERGSLGVPIRVSLSGRDERLMTRRMLFGWIGGGALVRPWLARGQGAPEKAATAADTLPGSER